MNLATALVATLVLCVGCTVDRRSTAYECASDLDCVVHGRICNVQAGYCVGVAGSCPAVCTGGCRGTTCNIDCTTSGRCSEVTCPAGYDCNVQCLANGACSYVNCTNAQSCAVTCSVPFACGPIDCGPGKCTVQCNTNSSCGKVSCTQSCACDVSCPSATCQTDCPTQQGNHCTTDGTPNATCASSTGLCTPGC